MRKSVRRHARTLPWEARTVLVGVAMVGLVALGSAVTRGGEAPPDGLDEAPRAGVDWSLFPTGDASPSATPPPTPSPSPAATTPVPATTGPAQEKAPATRTPAPAPTVAPSQPGAALTVGARVGLEPVTHPGFRVRHQHFLGRIDPIGSGNPALDKADSTFVVRAGLASRGCVSLEAVNHPGFYLRHQDFAIHLHRRDGSALFAADATFCPRAGLSGRDVSLRSYNFPERYLVHQGSRLFIAAPGDRAAMTFAVRTPL